ncbi:DUF5615 family PIN-like protein [Hymenobacter cavernae]|uniref:DUF5615 domain-containing protein n=1 Tax=Hymenobacter cavernae TaxID=2044852 RepID=A0ABQ1UIS3_9BACT|nr:DUF5615 family PIN-like protein [Hymenobacter cavernae]GGF20075.1 hypothetical protein GCM10011383_34610 [Hymenobacter cavernae]
MSDLPLRLLVDAQLPKRLARWLAAEGGCDCLHTLDLPEANRTSDGAISNLSVQEQRVVISKDADFVNTFLLHGKPYKLLLISTGNITTNELLSLFQQHLPAITNALQQYSYVELTRLQLLVH